VLGRLSWTVSPSCCFETLQDKKRNKQTNMDNQRTGLEQFSYGSDSRDQKLYSGRKTDGYQEQAMLIHLQKSSKEDKKRKDKKTTGKCF
jgi:hypothetical protein